MATARLKATHEDILRIQQTRRSLPTLAGLNDYRSILHAHAEDSAHTAGTRPEMLKDAKQAGVQAILLTDHHRPPRDFINDSWRGIREGVLFVPGSESRGFLIYPTQPIMDRTNEPIPAFIETVRRNDGLIFLSHIEERPEQPMTDLDGMEIYNRHADLKKDKEGVATLNRKLTDPAYAGRVDGESAPLSRRDPCGSANLPGRLPGEVGRRGPSRAARPVRRPMIATITWSCSSRWSTPTTFGSEPSSIPRSDQRIIAATDRPGIRTLTQGHQPGEVLSAGRSRSLQPILPQCQYPHPQRRS